MAPERLDTLALLVEYPDADLELNARGAAAGVRASSPEAAAELETFADAIAGTPVGALQERYTETFDLDQHCALDLGWHLFGDAHERGGFMAALREDLARVGVPETRELPDHLGRVLRLVAREDPGADAALVELIAPAIAAVHRALAARESAYVHVLAAVQAVLAGIVAESHREVSRR
jgi:nitrate reductase molybdenum cofactor assembly chaperone